MFDQLNDIHGQPSIIKFVVLLQYGDSYTEDVTEETLKELFKKMQEEVRYLAPSLTHTSTLSPSLIQDNCDNVQHPEDISITREEIAQIEERYFSEDNERGLFRQCKYVAIDKILYLEDCNCIPYTYSF